MLLFLSEGNYQVYQHCSRGCCGGKCTKHGGPQEADLSLSYHQKLVKAKALRRSQQECESRSQAAGLRLLTYELVQEDERGDVTGQAQELAHDHEPVPRLDGQSHHQQLRQDQRGEGDGDDVHKLGLEEQQRAVHDDASCGGAYGHMTSQTANIEHSEAPAQDAKFFPSESRCIFFGSFLAENPSWHHTR